MADQQTYSTEDHARVKWALRTYGGPLGAKLASEYQGGTEQPAQGKQQSEQGGEQTA